MLSLPLSWEDRNPLEPLGVAGGTTGSLALFAMGPLHNAHGYSGWRGFTSRDGTTFGGDVRCEMPRARRVVGYSFLAEVQLRSVCPPRAVLDPDPSLWSPGLAWRGRLAGSRAGAVLLKAFAFAFEGFRRQKVQL